MTDDGGLPESTANQVGRVAERVVKLETNVEYLKRDTEAIRASQHDMRNEMQKLVIAEQGLVGQMGQLVRDQSATQKEIRELTGAIHLLNEARHISEGGWKMAAKVGTVITGVVAVVAGIITMASHFWAHP